MVGTSKAPVALVLGETGTVASPGVGTLFQTAAQACLQDKEAGRGRGWGQSSHQVPELGKNGTYSGNPLCLRLLLAADPGQSLHVPETQSSHL